MKYYSTNGKALDATLEEAVVRGLASDKGLYMPRQIKPLPQSFYDEIETFSFPEIAYKVADAFFGEDVPAETLKQIVYDTLNFDVPAVKVKDNTLTGSYLMLLSTEAEKKTYELAANMTYMELSTVPTYMDEFVGACFIPHTDTGMFPDVMNDLQNRK